MGTRGAIGFKLDQKEIIFHNQYDSYPVGLGQDAVDYVRSVTDWNAVREQILAFEAVDHDAVPTQDQKDRARELGTINLTVSNKNENDFYCLTRNAQGDLGLQLALGFGELSNYFLHYGLFCEYAYIINLDTMELEFYEGFNQDRNAEGRYARGDDEEFERNGYAGVRLVGEVPLSDIPEDWKEKFYPNE